MYDNIKVPKCLADVSQFLAFDCDRDAIVSDKFYNALIAFYSASSLENGSDFQIMLKKTQLN